MTFPEYDALPDALKAVLELEAEARVKKKMNTLPTSGHVWVVTFKYRSPQIFEQDHDAEEYARYMRRSDFEGIRIEYLPIRKAWA